MQKREKSSFGISKEATPFHSGLEHGIPVKSMVYDAEKVQPLIKFLSGIVQIEHKFAKRFKYRLEVDQKTVENITHIVDSISGKPISYGSRWEMKLNNHEEKTFFVANFSQGRSAGYGVYLWCCR